LFANENIPIVSVMALRDAGHDVLSLSEGSPGATDEAALALARAEGRTLLTFDRDYGELIFGRGLPSPPCVIYLRFDPKTPTEPAEILQALFVQVAAAVEGYFFVVERDSFRRRPLPQADGNDVTPE